jgi:hypothetical protein
MRRFFLAFRTSKALSSKSGAMTTSVKISVRARAAASSTVRLKATTPPKAETGSVECARRYASAGEEPVPTPAGFMCLMTAQAVSSKSQTSCQAASAST